MDSLFSPELGLSVWTLVTFAILVFLLGRFAWKPFLKVLADREKTIRTAIEEAQNTRQAADDLRKQLDQEWASAKEKIRVMIAHATEDAQKRREQMVQEAEVEAKAVLAHHRAQLAAEREKAMQDLRQYVTKLSLELTEKILRHPLLEKDRQALVESLLSDLRKEKSEK